MKLAKRLAAIREGAKERIPLAARELMHKATDELRSTGIEDRALRIGGTMPAFSLTNIEGVEISSADLLSKGPLVVTFYRGVW